MADEIHWQEPLLREPFCDRRAVHGLQYSPMGQQVEAGRQWIIGASDPGDTTVEVEGAEPFVCSLRHFQDLPELWLKDALQACRETPFRYKPRQIWLVHAADAGGGRNHVHEPR